MIAKFYKELIQPPELCIVFLALLVSLTPAQAATIAAGNKTALYTSDIADGGNLFGWGANGSGQIGDGTQEDRLRPVTSAEAGPWLAVATNLTGISGSNLEGHGLGIKGDGAGGTQGTLWAWGDNSLGQLGQGDTTSRLVPTQVGSSSNWVAVEVGSAFSMALNANGEIYVWGDNRFGQLGSGVIATFQSIPTRLVDKDGTSNNNDEWISIAAGADYALAVHASSAGSPYGYIYGWGRNSVYQLGLGHDDPVVGPSSATRISGSTLWRSVEAGITSSFAIDSSWYLYSWGQGGFGGLGLGGNQGTSILEASAPTRVVNNVSANMRYSDVSAGSSHTLARSTSGQLFAVGQNASGQLGKVGSQLYNIFQSISNIPGFSVSNSVSEIAAGKAFSVIILEDGSVLTVGSNDRGQLGNGTTNSLSTFTATALGAVDLSFDSITILDDISSVAPGSPLDLQLILRNNGTGTIESTQVDALEITLVLSPNTLFGAEGELEFDEGLTFEVPAIDVAEITPNGSIAVNLTVTVPSPIDSGDYYILGNVDSSDVVEESDENNNIASTLVAQLLAFRSDLVISLDSPLVVTSVDAGDDLSVEVTLENIGTGSIQSGVGNGFEYRLFLSTVADESVGNVYELPIATPVDELPYEAGLNNGDSVLRSITVTIPEEVTLGDYFIGAVIDSAEDIAELLESNNTAISPIAVITVEGLSIREALDLPDTIVADVPGTLDVDESALPPGSLSLSGDSDWFGTIDIDAVDGDALSNPSLMVGESASLTFEFDEPREVTFKWKSATSGADNNLFFGANLIPLQPETAGAASRLFGTKDWTEVSYIVPKDTPLGFFYVQGIDAPQDRVFVDDLKVSPPITLPDYIVQSIEYTSGDYILQRDRLTVTVTGINRGALAALPADFDVKIWLSLDLVAGDEDDVLLGSLNSFQVLDNGSRFIYKADFVLPESLEDANYYALARVDSTNVVTEFNEATPFSLTDNNFRFSDEAGVNIDRRADLRVTNFAAGQEIPIFVGGPTDHPDFNPLAGENETKIFGQFIIEPKEGDNSEMAIRFDILNAGLAGVVGLDQAFNVRLYLAPSRDTEAADGFEIVSFVEDAGLAVGAARTYEITTNILENVPVGRFYYLGVEVDTNDSVPESREDNNTTLTENNEVFVGEVPLDVALNDDSLEETLDPLLDALEWYDGFISSNNNSGSPASPWFGQSNEFAVDSAVPAAAQSGPVAIGGTSFMETTIEVGAESRLVSFRWKVSSQREGIPIVEDPLTFSYREGDSGPFTEVARISGEVDWTTYQYTFTTAGTYTLRWMYQENGDGERSGQDAGWVDDFSAEAPDFAFIGATALTVDVASFSEVNGPVDGVLSPGDSFDLDIEIGNVGSGAYSNVRSQVRLTKSRGNVTNLDWTEGNFEDVVLFDGFLPLGVNSLTLDIPVSISEADQYYVGVWLEYPGNIAESSELNNLLFTETTLISIDPLVDFDDGVDYTPDPSNGWNLSGDGRWYPLAATVGDPEDIAFDNIDSVTAPSINEGQSAGFEAIIDGPKLMTFAWRTDSKPTVNYLELRINGQPQDREFGTDAGSRMRISGDTGWVEETILIPAGTQVVSWTYVKNDEEGAFNDNAWVDLIDPDTLAATAPDLAIESVDYTGGAYALERDQFPLTVIVANRGGDISAAAYDDLDLEVRLSEDTVFDLADALVGNLAVASVLESGAKLLFSGNIDLPVNLDAKNYYLLVRVSSLDPSFQEILDPGSSQELLSNNDFASELQDVEILLLPRLITRLNDLVVEKVYYPKQPLYFDWELVNIGLGDISGEQSYTQRIELWAFNKGTTGVGFDDLDNSEKVLDLVSVETSEYLPGILSRDDELESTLSYPTIINLPRAGVLLDALGETETLSEDEDIDVVSSLAELEEYTFFITIIRDTVIPQSSNLSITYYPSKRFKIAAFPFDGVFTTSATITDYDGWRNFNERVLVTRGDLLSAPTIPGASGATTFGNGIENLFYYALNLPFRADTRLDDEAVVGATLERFGTIFIDGVEYQKLTFPVVRGATDLVYTVQAASSVVGPWEDLAVIDMSLPSGDPAYLDTRGLGAYAGYYGGQTLTNPVEGSGSLLTLDTSAGAAPVDYKPVVSVQDLNYTANVTVRDYEAVGIGSRFMRLVVEEVP